MDVRYSKGQELIFCLVTQMYTIVSFKFNLICLIYMYS